MRTKLYQLNNLKGYTPVPTGVLIGLGGLNELSVIGIATWLLLNLRHCDQQTLRKLYWQDMVIFAISILWACYSSYNDPQLASDDLGLTANEAIKVALWTLFALGMSRSSKDTFFRTIDGIAYGIGLFALATTIGALTTQPFQGSYGAIYNIFTGDSSAGSTYIAYAGIASTLLLLLTNNKFAWIGSIACVSLGIQAVNRHSLIVGAIALTFLIFECVFHAWQKNSISTKKYPKKAFVVFLAFAVAGSFILASKALSLGVIERLSGFRGSDNRYNIYSTGYYLLSNAIFLNDIFILKTVSASAKVGDSSWWHSLPLDSARASGWLGLITSLFWIGGIAKGINDASIRRGRYILVGSLTLLTLLTSIPLGSGGYELLGSLTLTQAIASSNKA